MIAAEAGRADTVIFLLDKYPEEAILRFNAKTALSLALGGRHFRVAEYLVTHHPATAAIMAHPAEQLPLHVACLHGHAGLVRLLLSAHPGGASTFNFEGYLPIHCAAQSGHVEAFNLVLAAQPSLVTTTARNTRRTPLHFAAQDGHVDIVDSILRVLNSEGTDPATRARHVEFIATRSQDEYAVTALYSAVYRGHTAAALRLLGYAASLPDGPALLAKARNMAEKNTPLHALFLRHLEVGENGHVPTVDEALFHALRTAYPDASTTKNKRGDTALDLHVRFDEFYRAFQVSPCVPRIAMLFCGACWVTILSLLSLGRAPDSERSSSACCACTSPPARRGTISPGGT
jgi:ankyrin repeat protein